MTLPLPVGGAVPRPLFAGCVPPRRLEEHGAASALYMNGYQAWQVNVDAKVSLSRLALLPDANSADGANPYTIAGFQYMERDDIRVQER